MLSALTTSVAREVGPRALELARHGSRYAPADAMSSPDTLRYGALLDALASLASPVFFDEPRPAERAVRYAAGPRRGIPPVYDVYAPSRPSGASVVLVHGGGFVLGSRSMKPMRFLASRLVAAGIAVASVDYRLVFRGGRLDEAEADVRAALDHWRERAARVHALDPARVSIVGLSAGGTLAMLVAASAPAGHVHRLACAFGLYELDHLDGRLARALPRLLLRTPDRSVWRARSPRGVRPPSMPTLLVHGTADGLVPFQQAERLHARRESLGLPTRLVLYPGAPHGFFHHDVPATHAAADEIVAHVGR